MTSSSHGPDPGAGPVLVSRTGIAGPHLTAWREAGGQPSLVLTTLGLHRGHNLALTALLLAEGEGSWPDFNSPTHSLWIWKWRKVAIATAPPPSFPTCEKCRGLDVMALLHRLYLACGLEVEHRWFRSSIQQQTLNQGPDPPHWATGRLRGTANNSYVLLKDPRPYGCLADS